MSIDEDVDDDEQSKNQNIIQPQYLDKCSTFDMNGEKFKLWKGISTEGKIMEKHGSVRNFPLLRASTSLRAMCVSFQ